MYLWLRYILSCFLLPLVVPLGRHLRKTIGRLPEASGARSGIQGEPPCRLRVMSIGESPIAGVGLDHQSDNLTPQLAALIEARTNSTVEWFIFAKTGIRLIELWPQFKDDLPSRMDIIFIAMGVNDCKEVTSMNRWGTQWYQLYQQLRERYPEATILCSSVPPMASFPVLPWPVRLFLGSRSDLMNQILASEIKKWENAFYLPLPDFLSSEYFASDGFHPNALAHQKWCQGIADKITEVHHIPDFS